MPSRPPYGEGASLLVVTTAAVILGLLSAWGSPRDGPAAPTPAPSLAELAEQYRTADREDAVARAELLTRPEVEAEAERLREAATRARSAEQGDATLLGATALLTEVARSALHRGRYPRTRWELQTAARLVGAARSAKDASDFAGRFYLVALLMLHETADLAAAYEMLADGRSHVGDDAELLLAQGAVSETIATLRNYEGRDEPKPSGLVIEGEPGEPEPLPHTGLADAQALYEAALQREPGLLEAHLRLGRVLLLRGGPKEALPELERVARESPRPDQRYMAHLFEGRAREALGDVPGAARAFAAAAADVPRAQSALVALGRALDRLGQAARSQEAFDRAMLSEAQAPQDPWLNYILGQPRRIDALLEELRRRVP
jgi:tetratricopeptide (TPR) repeat protein